MKYIAGRVNLAATIFVPVKCGNNCPFCSTNQMYEGFVFTDEIMNNIIEKIHLCNDSNVVNEFVITGGEPLMNLDILKQIINECEKPVFINTSFPIVKNIDECIDYINSEHKIHGISVSRHIGVAHAVKTVGIEYLDKIKKSVRINCVVNESMLGDNLIKFIYEYSSPYRMINLRADYRTITTDNLKSRDTIDVWLLDHFRYEGANGCLVCNSEFFSDDDQTVICYHRGIEHSCVKCKNYCYVNDIIIDMYGNMFKDWDMVNDDQFNEELKNNTITH